MAQCFTELPKIADNPDVAEQQNDFAVLDAEMSSTSLTKR